MGPGVCRSGAIGAPGSSGGPLPRGGSVHIAHYAHLADGVRTLAAQVPGEGEPPAEYGADPVPEAGEEADVHEQPDPPADKAAEVQLANGNHGAAAGDVGGGPEIAI